MSDDALPFNPLAAAPPRTDQALVDRPIGGLGILLVKRLMDGVTYRRRAGRNRLVMHKRFSAASSAARGRSESRRR